MASPIATCRGTVLQAPSPAYQVMLPGTRHAAVPSRSCTPPELLQQRRRYFIAPPVCSASTQALGLKRLSSLSELMDDTYSAVAAFLDKAALCRVDAACRMLRDLNDGQWLALGLHTFHGLETEDGETFEGQQLSKPEERHDPKRRDDIRWKTRFGCFRRVCGLPRMIEQADEDYYFPWLMRRDVFSKPTAPSIYIEVDVIANPNNVIVALIDYEGGGGQSFTFSPDAGAVIRKRIVCESTNEAERAYIEVLPPIPAGARFHGKVGVFVCGGKVAFFRKQRICVLPGTAGAQQLETWESTGFVADLSWLEGSLVTPYIAFRGTGAYRFCIAPPLMSELPMAVEVGRLCKDSRSSCTEIAWRELNKNESAHERHAGV